MVSYKAEVLGKVENAPGTWNSIRVGVFRCEGTRCEQIGEYVRNYPNLFHTFCHFRVADKDFALYSRDYTATRIMELPSCRDIGGEDRHTAGFCPVDYFIPRYVERESENLDGGLSRYRVNEPKEEDLVPTTTTFTPLDEKTGKRIMVEKRSYPVSPVLFNPFGFIAGCIWGDDSSWKIQYLDLSDAHCGRIKRDDRFGYISLPDSLTLKQAISLIDYEPDTGHEWANHILIAVQKRFDLKTGKSIDDA